MDETLTRLLYYLIAHEYDSTDLLVAADRAQECEQAALEHLLRFLARTGLRPFPTGSRVYGMPREDSDWDFVILLPDIAAQRIHNWADRSTWHTRHTYEYRSPGILAAMRFGPVNLIVAPSPWAFAQWQQGTNLLKSVAPVTREDAVKEFSKRFENR